MFHVKPVVALGRRGNTGGSEGADDGSADRTRFQILSLKPMWEAVNPSRS